MPYSRLMNRLSPWSRLPTAILGALLWAMSQILAAADSASLEQRIKAAYLYNFAGYVEWPSPLFASPQSPITIGIIGSDSIAAELTQVAVGRTVQGRPVAVSQLAHRDALTGVHIIFVAADAAVSIKALTQAAMPRSILVVTETPHSLASGSIINFVVTERGVRFEIALDTADKSNLRLSSRLLSVAQSVRTGAH